METSERFQQIFKDRETIAKDGLVISFNKPESFLAIEQKEDRSKPLFILVSGTSESGKSHMGKHFVESGTGNRLKFYKTIAGVSDYMNFRGVRLGKLKTPFDFAEAIKDDNRAKKRAFQEVKREYLLLIKRTGVPVAIVETIKHPWIIEEFRRSGDLRTISVFVDAPIEERVKREAQKLGINRDEILDKTLNKDAWKGSFGNETIRLITDVVINNAGNLSTFNDFLSYFEIFIRRVSKPFTGSPQDFS